MHGRFNLAPGETHHAVLLDYLAGVGSGDEVRLSPHHALTVHNELMAACARAQSLVMVDPWPARFFGLWRSSLDNAYGGLTARSASGRAHGLLRLVRTDGTQASRDSHRFGVRSEVDFVADVLWVVVTGEVAPPPMCLAAATDISAFSDQDGALRSTV